MPAEVVEGTVAIRTQSGPAPSLRYTRNSVSLSLASFQLRSAAGRMGDPSRTAVRLMGRKMPVSTSASLEGSDSPTGVAKAVTR